MMLYRTHRTPPGISTKAHHIPGYGYEVRTDLTKLSSKVMKGRTNRTCRVGYTAVQNSKYKKAYPTEHNLETFIPASV